MRSIGDIVEQAQKAIDGGNYSQAIDTCRRVLGQFPEFAAAHRLMGEAHLEQGEPEAAREAFYQTLLRDPQSIPAHVGLGMIASEAGESEAGESEAALAHFQVAWEIDPRRRDLREHVTRLSREVYGAEGRLFLTRAALASLHFHAGRWSRAITESSQVLQEHENRVDVQIRLAEALWRFGDDEHAERLCSAILDTLPSAVVPLLILADVRRRQGRSDEARGLLERARAIDPDGVRAADLMLVGWDEQAAFFEVEEPPVIDDAMLAEEPAASRYAPAPDFMVEEKPAPASPPTEPRDQVLSEQTAAASEPPADEFAEIEPFRWEDITDEDLDSPSAVYSPEETGQDQPEQDSVSFELFSDEDLERARPPEERPRGFTRLLESLEREGMAPFDPSRPADQPADLAETRQESAPVHERQEAGPGELSGASDVGGLDEMLTETQIGPAAAEPVEDAADDDPLSVDWSKVDEEIQSAIPGEMPRGYTDQLNDLDRHGIQPFSFEPDVTNGFVPEEPAAGSGEESLPEPVDDELFDLPDFDLSDEPLGPADRGQMTALPQDFDFDFDDVAREMDVRQDDEPAHETLLSETFSGFSFDEDMPSFGDDETDDIADVAGEGDVPDWLEADVADLEADEVSDVVTGEPMAVSEPVQGPVSEEDVLSALIGAGEDDLAEPWHEEPEPASAAAPGTGGLVDTRGSVEALGMDASLLDRLRSAKAQLVGLGRLKGDERLPGVGPSIEELEAELALEPGNPERHLTLANALAEVDPPRALDEYRWVFRHAGGPLDSALAGVIQLAESGGNTVVAAHRLAGAIYRRRGDWQASASHYEESLVASQGRER
jgi:tetratricopeptide (TPR) repeat protein